MSRSEADAKPPMTKLFLGIRTCTTARTSNQRAISSHRPNRGTFSLFLFIAFIAICPSRLYAQAPPQIVGRVEGRDFVIEEPSGAPPITGEPSRLISAPLASGSHLDVRNGQVRILLNGGGEIVICGAARLQLLKSQGALTVALDYGTLHINFAGDEPLTIFTPLVVATPLSIGGGTREATIGLERTGQMCLRAASGAVRIEQQLSGQSLLVPQFGQLSLSGGQLASASPSALGCTCEIEAAKVYPSRPSATRDTVIALTPSGTKLATEPKKTVIAPPVPIPNPPAASDAAAQAPPTFDVPIYKVLMPPLVYDPSSPVPPPDPSPATIILVRSVRVREDTVISGTIEPNGKRDSYTLAAKADPNAQQPQPGFFARIGGFFRRVFGGKS